jgi:RNA-directed DNA polymerase
MEEIGLKARGWINYFGVGSVKGFLKKTQSWLNHRIRQLIWKRWKLPRTRYRNLRKYGVNHDGAMKMISSGKGYWRLTKYTTLHVALTTDRLYKWGLINLVSYYEKHWT